MITKTRLRGEHLVPGGPFRFAWAWCLTLLVGLAAHRGAQAATAAGGSGAALQVEPSVVGFPSSGGSARITVTNRGGAPLELYSLVLAEGTTGFQVTQWTPTDGSKRLAPGESLPIDVRYTPDESTQRRQVFGALQLYHSDPASPAGVTAAALRGDPTARGGVTGVALRAGEHGHLLSWIVFLPLLAVLLVLLLPAHRPELIRLTALLTSVGVVALAAALYQRFDPRMGAAAGNYGLQLVERAVWIRAFSVEYYLGVDGISILMVLLTALVSAIAVGSSWTVTKHVKGYFAMLLLLETGMLGVFVAADFFLFYVFWEVMLLPMYFLIGIWGGPRKEYAAIKFFLYTLVGSVLMLLAMLALYYHSGATTLVDGTPVAHTFDLMKLAYANDFSSAPKLLGVDFGKLLFVALFLGFAVKLPMVPLHTWLPDAHVEAPTAISVILAGVLLKMGAYGILRINFAILPEASAWAAAGLALFGVINILYGALCAMAQRDLKKIVAYSSVSHMGYCLLGMAAMTHIGVSGAMLQMFNHGTITAMLFLLVGVLYDRTHTRGVDEFGGVAAVMPRYAGLFGLAFMASLGLPGLSGFIGEALVFFGAFPVFRLLTMAAVVGVVLTAGYHLWALQRIQLGPFNERWRVALAGHDLDARELALLAPLAVLIIVLGFYPMPLLELTRTSVGDLLRLLAPPHALADLASLRR